jgi:hypothetical protein
MGAWGVGAFENDTAADWDLEFETADMAAGLRLITDAQALAPRSLPSWRTAMSELVAGRGEPGSGQVGIWVVVQEARGRAVVDERVAGEPFHGAAACAGVRPVASAQVSCS